MKNAKEQRVCVCVCVCFESIFVVKASQFSHNKEIKKQSKKERKKRK